VRAIVTNVKTLLSTHLRNSVLLFCRNCRWTNRVWPKCSRRRTYCCWNKPTRDRQRSSARDNWIAFYSRHVARFVRNVRRTDGACPAGGDRTKGFQTTRSGDRDDVRRNGATACLRDEKLWRTNVLQYRRTTEPRNVNDGRARSVGERSFFSPNTVFV